MPTWAAVLLTLTVLVCGGYLFHQIKQVRLKRRNLRHWEKGEPLEGGVDKWD